MKTVKGKKLQEKKRANRKAAEIEEERALMKLQREYKHAVLVRLYKGAELIEIRRQLEENDIQMQWFGIPFPKTILTMEHDLQQLAYGEIIMEENYKKQALKNKGFKKEHLDKLVETSEYFKEAPNEGSV